MFKTSDIHVAAALLAYGEEYIGVEAEDARNRRAIFKFYLSDTIEDAVKDYMNDKIRLPPRTLFGRLRELKGLAANVGR